MSHTHDRLSHAHTRLGRRTMLRGTAWTIPVIAVVANAPAFAASGPVRIPGINGWVNVNYGTDFGFNASYDSDPDGVDPASPDGAPFGLYVYDPNLGSGGTAPGTSDVLTAASITLWFRGTVGSWSFEPASSVPNGGGHGTGWASPVYVGTQVKPDGLTYYGYQFAYTGTYALGDNNTRIYLQDFGATAHGVNSDDATWWVERKITVDGVLQTFQRRNGERGPLGPGFPSQPLAGKSGDQSLTSGGRSAIA